MPTSCCALNDHGHLFVAEATVIRVTDVAPGFDAQESIGDEVEIPGNKTHQKAPQYQEANEGMYHPSAKLLRL